MNKPKITVITCMYKGEGTVRQMIDCVLNQTFKDFEYILVDDGSPDKCGEIAEEYAKKDSRIRVLHKPNGGLASARNAALEIAQGEYTIQFDQDDFVESNCLEEMLKAAEEQKVDVLIADYYRGDQYVMHYVSQKPTSLDHLSVLKDLFGPIQGFCWNKLIRLDVYQKYHIQFPLDIYSCEDQYAMAQIFMNDVKVGYLSMAFSKYMYNANSLIRYYDEHTYQVDVHTRDQFVKLLKDFPEAQAVANDSKTRAIVLRAFIFGRYFFSNSEFKKELHYYAPIVKKSKMIWYEKWPIYFSCKGSYHFWNSVYHWGLNLKQVAKKLYY